MINESSEKRGVLVGKRHHDLARGLLPCVISVAWIGTQRVRAGRDGSTKINHGKQGRGSKRVSRSAGNADSPESTTS